MGCGRRCACGCTKLAWPISRSSVGRSREWTHDSDHAPDADPGRRRGSRFSQRDRRLGPHLPRGPDRITGACVLRRDLLGCRGVKFWYRGRLITASDLGTIRALLAARPALSRRALSRAVCEIWQWRQPNGTLCDAICRGLLLALHRAGHIQLPAPQWTTAKPWRPRTSAPPVLIDTTPIETTLRALGALTFAQVRRTPDEGLFNSLLAEYHYLGYQQPVGEHLKFLVVAGDRPVACLAWGSAPGALGPRDRFIGWNAEARRRHLRLLAYNPRFLIPPWVRVPHVASHVLGRMAARLSRD